MMKPVIPIWIDLLASICGIAAWLGLTAMRWEGAVAQVGFYAAIVTFAVIAVAGVSAQLRILWESSSAIGLASAALLSIRLGAAPWLWGALGIVVAVTLYGHQSSFLRLATLMVIGAGCLLLVGIGKWIMERRTP